MTTIEMTLFIIFFISMLISWILFVVFGQLTVRKLRKNPETKKELGFEFVSGWDIINVAEAMAFPYWLSKKLQESNISFMYANKIILLKHTNKFDRCLGAVFYWLMMSSGLLGILLLLLNFFGFF